MDSKERGQVRVKIADFGLALRLELHPYATLKCGTPGYIAPEVLLDQHYNEKADIYSCGIILYFM
jgi:serine/threonine protein kinase